MRGITDRQRHERLPAREATALYLERRGRVQGMSSRRLRWQLRLLPKHSADERTKVRRRAVADELKLRDVSGVL